ncbi:MAG: hypothetical protein N3F05_02230 [Candidatus Diapherotrites archaeon]|nr:hypothetical protein [Candidatus Diapherotrites archaeon]
MVNLVINGDEGGFLLKAQASVEFMVLLSFLLVIFVFSISIATGQHEVFLSSKKTSEAKLLARTLASEINAVFLAGNGAEKSLFLRNFGDYNVAFGKHRVFVEWGGSYVSEFIIANDVNAPSAMQGKELLLKNISGGVKIEVKQ